MVIKMDEYYHVAEALPQPLRGELAVLSTRYAPYIQEIRLRAGQAVQFTVGGRLTPCSKYLPGAHCAAMVSAEELQACFLHLCRHSVFAYEDELAQGYLTIAGGNRVGVAGSRSGGSFSAVTSLNLRVARWLTCELPPELPPFLASAAGGVLVAGAPGSGKTTFLRTLVQHLGRSESIVCVIDERGELMAGECGGLPMPAAARCDVYTRCPKEEGIRMALRCMNPHYIICDELGTRADAAALEEGVASGVVFLASVHCEDADGLHKKPQLARLLQTGAFAKAIFLAGRTRPGAVARCIDL